MYKFLFLFFMLGSIRKQNFFGAGVLWSIAILIKPNTLLIAPAFVFLKRSYMLIGSIFFIIVVLGWLTLSKGLAQSGHGAP